MSESCEVIAGGQVSEPTAEAPQENIKLRIPMMRPGIPIEVGRGWRVARWSVVISP